MNGLMKSTYTYASLKENILKLLGEYSLNGTENSSVSGFMADIEKRYIACLNICLRRVILSLPLLSRSADLQFFGGKAVLPDDFGSVESLFIAGVGSISENSFRISGGMLECNCVDDGGFASFIYKVNPRSFTPDEPSWTPVDLPDITADALCYLTAAELCPAEYGELYSKLMYKYRDICLNAYGCDDGGRGRNTFFKGGMRRSGLFSKKEAY